MNSAKNGTYAGPPQGGRADRTIELASGKTMTDAGEWSHYRQIPGPQENWQESVVISWFDEKNDVGGFHRLGHEPNLQGGGRIALWTNFSTPDGQFKRVQDLPIRDPQDIPLNGGYGSGDDTCRVEYVDGEHVWMIEDDGVSAILRHKDIAPNVDGFPKGSTLSGEFSTAHFDVAGAITGWLKINGKHYNINGLSIRDHGWGPRDWSNSILNHRWVVGTCGPQFSFYAVAYHAMSSDRIAKFGWVVRDGVIAQATEVDILAYLEVDGCSNRGGHVTFTLSTGEVLEVEVRGYPNHKAFICHYHGISCVDRPSSFTCGDFKGSCTFESSTNVHAGSRKPGTVHGGVIGTGWTTY